jgi:hypothetical protein
MTRDDQPDTAAFARADYKESQGVWSESCWLCVDLSNGVSH